jgi:NAD(P)-dependent dehydrogenase (short-subunit alcohol dehydrogenase family)
MTIAKFQRLDGKVAIITGGAGLLGPEFGAALAEQGADVVLVDVSQEKVVAAAQTLTSFGGNALGLQADITDPASVGAMVKEALAEFGRIDILVNGAAGRTPGFFASFEDYELSDWNDVVSVNLSGTFLCCQAVGRYMKENGGGSIINTSSIYGVVGPDQRVYEGSSINTPAVYSASKAGVIGLTRYLATYWAKDNIRVNTITPGGVANHQDEEFVKQYERRTPLGRMAQPHELRGAIVFLASDMGSYVTGHNLIVDGGWTAW